MWGIEEISCSRDQRESFQQYSSRVILCVSWSDGIRKGMVLQAGASDGWYMFWPISWIGSLVELAKGSKYLLSWIRNFLLHVSSTTGDSWLLRPPFWGRWAKERPRIYPQGCKPNSNVVPSLPNGVTRGTSKGEHPDMKILGAVVQRIISMHQSPEIITTPSITLKKIFLSSH